MTWRPGQPLPVPVRHGAPAGRPGQGVIYVDARTRELVLALDGSQHALAREAELDPAARRAPAQTPTPAQLTASATLRLDSLLGGPVSAVVSVPGARVGQLAQVGYGSQLPRQVQGAPFARVTAPDQVTVTVPLAATLSAVPVLVLVTVTPI